MFTQKVQDAINDQIKLELESAYVYLSMSAYCETLNLNGMAAWLRGQSKEELEHAMKFFTFVHDRGGRVVLQAIAQPPTEFASPVEIFEKALNHERHVSAQIHKIYDLAVQEHDHPTQVMLHWFIDEQVEEEKTASEILAQLKMVEGSNSALLMLDKQLGKRGAAEEDDD